MDVRFALVDLRGIDQVQPLHAVAFAGGAQLLESWDLAVAVCDDQLSAPPLRNAVCGAELVEHARTFDTVARFERSRGIVNTGMNDLAVVGARAHAGPRLSLQHAHAAPAACHRFRRAQPHHASTNHDDVDLFHLPQPMKYDLRIARLAAAHASGCRFRYSICDFSTRRSVRTSSPR